MRRGRTALRVAAEYRDPSGSDATTKDVKAVSWLSAKKFGEGQGGLGWEPGLAWGWDCDHFEKRISFR